MKMTLSSVKVECRENYDINQTYILTPNHQSAFDIFCCFSLFKKSYAFVSKDGYGKIPFIGMAMYLSNYILIRRGTVGAGKSIDDMKDRLKSKTSLVIYPEGSRSSDGEIRKPKRGILKISETCQDIPILPVVIYGTKDIMKAKTIKIIPFRKIKVRFLKPFYFKDIQGDDIDKLNYWYELMKKNYDELKNS